MVDDYESPEEEYGIGGVLDIRFNPECTGRTAWDELMLSCQNPTEKQVPIQIITEELLEEREFLDIELADLPLPIKTQDLLVESSINVNDRLFVVIDDSILPRELLLNFACDCVESASKRIGYDSSDIVRVGRIFARGLRSNDELKIIGLTKKNDEFRLLHFMCTHNPASCAWNVMSYTSYAGHNRDENLVSEERERYCQNILNRVVDYENPMISTYNSGNVVQIGVQDG